VSAPLLVVDLGRRRYGEVLLLQRALVDRRLIDRSRPDLLLLVEHEPVVTLGRGTRAASLPVSPTALERSGLEVFEVERGGDVTWHGPGQLVGYPILDLEQHRADLHWYLRRLEGSLIKALGNLGVAAAVRTGLTGVWTGGRKIASIGIHVRRWVTYHGFALNVSTDPAAFDAIVPCGIPGVEMTSVARELAKPADPESLWNCTRDAVVEALGQAFDRDPSPADFEPPAEIDSAEIDSREERNRFSVPCLVQPITEACPHADPGKRTIS
jgi:lipoyl(octanoyl) transferase